MDKTLTNGPEDVRSNPTSAPYREGHLGQILHLSEPQFLMHTPGNKKKNLPCPHHKVIVIFK